MENKAGQPILMFDTMPAFEAWLAAGPSVSGAWIRFAKKGAPFSTLSKQEAIDAALCHGWIDGQLASYDAESWLIRFTPRSAKSKWSQINRDRASALIDAGRMQAAGLAQVQRAQEDGRWAAAYASQSKIEMPADFQAALDARPQAKAFFGTIDSANRYAMLYRLHNAKKPGTRAAHIEKFVAMLERGETIHAAKAQRSQAG